MLKASQGACACRHKHCGHREPAQYQSQPPAYQQPQYHQQQYQVTQQPQQQQYAAGQSYQQALGQPPPSMSYPGQGLEQADPSRKRPAEPHQVRLRSGHSRLLYVLRLCIDLCIAG